ncbi:hypothetical protein ARMSODRAFT_974664 [Armillaria solidipes]|uniref:Uncharacterized protein n=1 Tax=Armillaria solidipes TaxID=1076256 RepID=A0A2H3BH59_9AGAR|nr:hypothetical protein ARMSODRAFT_974664 [Armillaria solidipes]
MLKATSVELLLYGALLLIRNDVTIHAALAIGTFWIVVVRDKGGSRFIRCGLVIVMYLIATSPLAIRWTFVQGITDDETQETTYIYSPGIWSLSDDRYTLPGNACATQIDWMLPYFSLSLAIMILCTLVIIYHIEEETRWLWIKVIIESSLLFAAAPVFYITSDKRMRCPLLVVTMITSLAPILAIAQIPSNNVTATPGSGNFELSRLETGGNAGSAAGEN